MRRSLLVGLVLSNLAFAQSPWYAAAKSGLNLREKADPSSKIIQLIPYGKSISVKYPDKYIEYVTENFQGVWLEAVYGEKKGYIFSEFIFPIPPPDSGIKSLQQYVETFPAACGPVNTGTIGNIDGLGSDAVTKFMTKNGIQYYTVSGHEYESFVCMLPSFNIYKTFHLLRLFPRIIKSLGTDDDFPLVNRTVQLNEYETFSIEMIKNNGWVSEVTMRWEGDGYPEQIRFFFIGGEIIIVEESG